MCIRDSSLDASDKDGETSWEIRRTNTLENDLVGGLMNDLTDPDILSPEDTILVYLNTLKNMSAEELGNYLNADSIISTEDPAKISLAEALVKQVHSTFDYSIGETTVSGYTATVTANITTFDSDAILENYQKELDSYLASVDAVIDGAQKRYEKSYSLLLEYIEENTATKTVETTFTLINDCLLYTSINIYCKYKPLLTSKCINRIQVSRLNRRKQTKDDTDQHREYYRAYNRRNTDGCR